VANHHSGIKNFFIFDDISSFVKGFQFNSMINYPVRLGMVTAIICEKGYAKIRIGLENYTIEDNTFLIILPEQIVEYIEIDPDFKAGYILLEKNFFYVRNDLKMALGLQSHFFEQPCFFPSPKEMGEIIVIFNLIKDKIEEKTNLFLEEIVQTYVRVLFYIVCNSFIKSNEKSVKNRKEEIFETFISLLQNHFRNERNMSWYAEKIFLTPKYLSSLIYEISGKHGSDWIRDFVILEAKALLNSSSLTIQQISEELGFGNPSHFGTYFKRFTGLSPKAYKNGKTAIPKKV
jgi:YesN/AraC family two-component response regulator